MWTPVVSDTTAESHRFRTASWLVLMGGLSPPETAYSTNRPRPSGMLGPGARRGRHAPRSAQLLRGVAWWLAPLRAVLVVKRRPVEHTCTERVHDPGARQRVRKELAKRGFREASQHRLGSCLKAGREHRTTHRGALACTRGSCLACETAWCPFNVEPLDLAPIAPLTTLG